MDLNSMLNDGPPPEKKRSQGSPLAPPVRANAPHVTPTPPPLNGAHYASGHYPPARPEQQASVYAPPPASTLPPSQSRGLTPLQTPSHPSAGGQYPFPQQQQQPPPPLQSPAAAHPGQTQYRPYESSYSATTPGGRPPSHGYPSHNQPATTPTLAHYPQHTSSLSPTPPSHHAQTPHPTRQSPFGHITHPPQQQPGPPPYYQHSQPSTPLGPPPHIPQRHSNQLEMSSPHQPYHQRTMSGTSNGIISGSPAQHHPSIGNLVESPSLYHRPSPARRRTSDYHSSVDRERSESVSPKTIVPPKPSSLGSRNSSQQDMYSARSSLPPSASVAPRVETPSHVQSHTSTNAKPPHSFLASEGAQTHSLLSGSVSSDSGSAANAKPSLSNIDNNTHPSLQHQTQKMGMNRLLTPTQLSQQTSLQNDAGKHIMNSSLKRPAETHSAEPESKRGRRGRKYTERPVWAHLHPQNPRARESGAVPNGIPLQQHQQRPNGQQAPVQPNGNILPWQEDPPLDHDLINARRHLGPWEKSLTWNTHLPEITKRVIDWVAENLNRNADIGMDPQQGTIEIEAKVGTLVDVSTGHRCDIPVTSSCVINPHTTKGKYRFESRMDLDEYQKMNKFLNYAVQESHKQKGREKVIYKRIKETDSFRTLNEAGLRALPEAARRRPVPRDLRLRTSVSTDDGKVTARIVKISLADHLHIFGAAHPYDLRLSMNLEVNMDRPGLHPEALVIEKSAERDPQPDRTKNRVSYRHLVYNVDLTSVDRINQLPSFELELEVDSNRLREQLAALTTNGSSGFIPMVEGFVENATYLMEQR